MSTDDILDIIIRHTKEVVPSLRNHNFSRTDALRDLGANSIDRSEIVMMTLESLSLDIPLVEVARAENIGELAGILRDKF